MNRYLTPREKILTVSRWLEYRSSHEIPEDAGGRGYPDPEVFPLTDQINNIDGVCTIQSCSGHISKDLIEGEPCLWNGQLWLRLSEPMMHRAVACIYDLTYCRPNIERVQVIFDRDGDVLDISFVGLNKDAASLEESGRIIVDFLKNRAQEVAV